MEIPHPLTLATGSHSSGSEYGCIMNVVSYINGDVEITDYPSCTHRVIARLLQKTNDIIGYAASTTAIHGLPATFILPQSFVFDLLELGRLSMGTARVPVREVYQWICSPPRHDLRTARDGLLYSGLLYSGLLYSETVVTLWELILRAQGIGSDGNWAMIDPRALLEDVRGFLLAFREKFASYLDEPSDLEDLTALVKV